MGRPRAKREAAMRKKALGALFSVESDEGDAAAGDVFDPCPCPDVPAAAAPPAKAGAAETKKKTRVRSVRKGALGALFSYAEDVGGDDDGDGEGSSSQRADAASSLSSPPSQPAAAPRQLSCGSEEEEEEEERPPSQGAAQKRRRRCARKDDSDYEDPFEDDVAAIKKRREAADDVASILAGMGEGVTVAHRQESLLRLLERVATTPAAVASMRHDVDDIFAAAARVDPTAPALAALRRVSLLCCAAIATRRVNACLLGPAAWDALLAMLQTALSGSHTLPADGSQSQGESQGSQGRTRPGRAPRARGGGCGANNATAALLYGGGLTRRGTPEGVSTAFLKARRTELAALSARVASQCEMGPHAPAAAGEETAVSLLLSCLVSLVVNADHDALAAETASTERPRPAPRSFAKAPREKPGVRIPRYWARIPAAPPLVSFLATRLDAVFGLLSDAAARGLPAAFEHVSPKVLLRGLYLVQLVSLYAGAVPAMRRPLLDVAGALCVAAAAAADAGDDAAACDEVVTRCMWILVHLSPTHDPFMEGERALLARPALRRSLEGVLANDFEALLAAGRDPHDRLCVNLNLLANIVQRCGEPADAAHPPVDVHRLAAAFFAMKQLGKVDAFVVGSYTALLLAVVSLTSEERRLEVSKAVRVADTTAAAAAKDYPLTHVAAALQEFVLFQSQHSILTADVCTRIADVNARVMEANKLVPTGSRPSL